jgi:uncharacterized protein YcnI
MIRRLLAMPALALVVLVLTAAVAGAHVELDPGEAVAGSTTTLTFSFHHGKDGTATTGLQVLLPPSAVDTAAGTVTWSGGSVPDGTEAELPVVVRLPDQPGEALFKTIQTTEAGELAWIEQEESEAEGAYPAPRLVLTAEPDATTTTEATTTTVGGSETTESGRALPGTTLEAEQRDDGTTNPAPWLIGSGVAAAVAVGVGGYVLKRRAG